MKKISSKDRGVSRGGAKKRRKGAKKTERQEKGYLIKSNDIGVQIRSICPLSTNDE
jgi:hypothetical protein